MNTHFHPRGRFLPNLVNRTSLMGLCLASTHLFAAISPEGAGGGSRPELHIQGVPNNGGVTVIWSDPTWRLQSTPSLSAPTWSAIGRRGDLMHQIIAPMGPEFFRLTEAARDCPLPMKETLPSSVSAVDAPFARRGPFPAHPTLLPPDQQDHIGSRFQQIWNRPYPSPVYIGAISFRLDGNTPRSGYAGDLTWQVDMRLGTTPLSLQQLQPAFDANLQGATIQRIYRGYITLTGTGQGTGPQAPPQPYLPSQAAAIAETIRVELPTPFYYDPTRGNLILEVRVDGVSGEDFEVLFDATEPGQQMVSIWAEQGANAPIGQPAPGGAVVQFDIAREWPVPVVSQLSLRCIDSLDLSRVHADPLLLALQQAKQTADGGQFPQTSQAISNYFVHLDSLVANQIISSNDAISARLLGEYVGTGLRATPAIFDRMAGHIVGAGMGYPIIRVPGAVRNMTLNAFQYAEEEDRDRGIAVMELFDEHAEIVFADGVITQTDQAEYDAALTNLCQVVMDLQNIPNMPEIWKQVFRDLKTIFEAQGLLTQALASIKSIFEDGKIDFEDRGALRSLKHTLEAIIDLLESNGLVRELLEGLLQLICQLLDAVVSGDLVSIRTEMVGDKLFLYIDVTEPVELRLIQFFIPKELLDGLPFDIPIGLDVTVKESIVIRFCPTADGVDIEFDPPTALDLDLDLDIPFAVELLEDETGIPDLDHLCIKSIKMVGKKLVIEAMSDGKDVRIEVDGGETKIFVDGMKVYPK